MYNLPPVKDNCVRVSEKEEMGNIVVPQMKEKQNRTHSCNPIYQHVGQTAFIMCVSRAQVRANFTDVLLLPYMINQIICNYHLELVLFSAEFIIT